MILLFLDTETTGLKPIEDQIIELGGLIVNFDPISLEFKEIASFESTVALRKQLDEKITRLTGITKEELSFAQDLIPVQEKWLSFLEPYEDQIEGIIGHSIDFDLGFLRQENWFLPNVKIIDTLDLCRIIFADFEAINLEFLVNSLNINFETTGNHHRSLFDTKATYHLFKIIINRLNILKLPQNYLDLIISNFLNLNIQFYSTSDLEISTSKAFLEEEQVFNKLTLNGNIITESTEKRLEKLNSVQILETINKLLATQHSKKVTILLLQIGTVFYLKNVWPNKNYKIHLQRGLQDYWLLDFLLKFLEKNLVSRSTNYKLLRIESLIWNVNSISQNHLELGKIVEFLEILNFYQKVEDKFHSIASTHDFLLVAVAPFASYGQYKYNPQTSGLVESNLIEKLVILMSEIQKLKQNLELEIQKNLIIGDKLNFQEDLIVQILNLIDGFSWDKKHKLQINTFNNLVTLSVDKPEFKLNQHFLDIKQKYPDLVFESYLPQVLLERMKIILNLDLEITTESEETEFEFTDRIEVNNFLEEKLFLAQESNKPVVVLAGINSTLKELKNQALNSDKAEKYLILGENGSTTKIISKIISGFSGVVICKINNLEQFLKTLESTKFAEVTLVNQPYFFVDDYWKNVYKLLGFDSYNGDKELKYLYLKSLQYYYKNVYGVFLNFVRGY